MGVTDSDVLIVGSTSEPILANINILLFLVTFCAIILIKFTRRLTAFHLLVAGWCSSVYSTAQPIDQFELPIKYYLEIIPRPQKVAPSTNVNKRWNEPGAAGRADCRG